MILDDNAIPQENFASEPKRPDSNNRQEYVITLHSHDDLDHFYDDMETPGGSLYIPDRAIPVEQRLPSSRNTSYRLTAEEVELIRQDPRVSSVELHLDEAGLRIVPTWTQTVPGWSKGSFISNYVNWGLKRCIDGFSPAGWGNDVFGGYELPGETISTTSSGRNVDVVICDDHIKTNHPEMAKNADGTGGTRVIEYNWYQHKDAVLGGGNGTYTYAASPSGNHGPLVASIAVGNTCGWARDANVYMINPYGTSGNSPEPATSVFQFVKQFHLNKPINPATGRKNPTVMNCSWEFVGQLLSLPISSMRHLGVVYNTSSWSLNDFAYPSSKTGGAITTTGITQNSSKLAVPVRVSYVEADMADMVNAGVILVFAAGNSSLNMQKYSANVNDHYNDYLISSGTTYYHRQGTVACANDTICVGSLSAKARSQKSSFSNTNARIDIWAPGETIEGASNVFLGVYDPRNGSYYKNYGNGTSFAAPQVAGIIGCMLETYPYLTHAEVRDLLLDRFVSVGQMQEDPYSTSDNVEKFNGVFNYLGGANNSIVYLYPERPLTGNVFPKKNMKSRPSYGQLWPRPRIKRI
jgi:hypothetical protein